MTAAVNAVQDALLLDLPMPPSVNRRIGKLGNKSPEVQKWMAQADLFYLAQHRRKPPKIMGDFELDITWDERRFGKQDWDNPIKGLCDWLQRVELIKDDRYCRRGVVQWGKAPEGCRVILRPWVTQ